MQKIRTEIEEEQKRGLKIRKEYRRSEKDIADIPYKYAN